MIVIFLVLNVTVGEVLAIMLCCGFSAVLGLKRRQEINKLVPICINAGVLIKLSQGQSHLSSRTKS